MADSDNLSPTQLTRVTSLNDSDLFIVSIDIGTAPKTRAILKSDAITAASSDPIGNKRLSLESGVRVSTTDQTAKSTVYWTDGTTNLSVAVPATTSTPFDIFYSISAGTLSTVNWTNDSTRATALAYSLGYLVKSGDIDKMYLGTGRTTGTSGQCEDSIARRLLWNYYNRLKRNLVAIDPTNTWAYTTATWRAANANTTDGVGRVAFVIGVNEGEIVRALGNAQFYNTSSGVQTMAGVGLDVTNANSAIIKASVEGTANIWQNFVYSYEAAVSAGYHFLQRVEFSQATGTTTWAGDNNSADRQTGMTVEVKA